MTVERGGPNGPATDGGVLLHREAEIAVISQCWERLAAGQPSVVLIKGARGIGKSALLTRAVSMLPQPTVVLRARCTATETSFPLSVVGQLFDSVIDPASSTTTPRHTAADLSDDGSAPHDLLHGLFQTTRSLAIGSPVVIAIDDLHLADRQSLQWFSYITRRLDDLPVTVIATVAADAQVLTADLDAPQMTTVLHPRPLCDTCTEELAAELLDGVLDPDLAAACFTISQGNPLVLHTLVRQLSAAGISPGAPDLDQVWKIGAVTLAETTVEWLHRGDPAAAELLAGLAVLGPAADPAIAAMLVGQGEYVAGQSWDTLIRGGLIDPGPPGAFANPLLGTAVLSRIPTADRLRMHARAAELLMRLGSPATEAAEHVLLVGGAVSDEAPGILRSAASAAADVGDWADAVRYLRRALAESTEPATTAELSAQLAAIELHHDLRSSLRYAGTVATTITDPLSRALALSPLVGPLMVADAGPGVRVFIESSAELTRLPLARSLIGQNAIFNFGAMALLIGHRTGLRRWVRALPAAGSAGEATPVAESTGTSTDRAAGGLIGALSVLVAAGGRHRDTALRLARRSAESGIDGSWLIGAVLTHAWAGELALADELATRMVSEGRAAHHRAELALALTVRADIALRRGRVVASVNDAQEAIRLAELTNAQGVRTAAAAVAALGLIEQGHLDEATGTLASVSAPEGHPLVIAALWHARSVLALNRGNADEALRLALESGHRLASHGIANPVAVRWRSAAVAAYLALGATDAALTLATEDVAFARRWRSPEVLGAALAVLSSCLKNVETAEGAAGFDDATVSGRDRVTAAQDAVRLLDGTDAELDTARALTALAVALRGAGLNSEAAQAQHRASDLRARCGAVRGVAPTTSSLQPARPARSRIRLTASETRVSDLVLQGMSNQEVADELCISRRTVDTHLNRIYRKLEIRSRSELAAALEQLP